MDIMLFSVSVMLISTSFIDSCHGHPFTKTVQNNTIEEIKDSNDALKNSMVDLINCYRSCHSVSPLTRSSQVEMQSEKWAQYLGSTGSFQHSSSNYGENLYAGRNSLNAINMWYFECFGKYVYNSENNPLGCGHFTQLVWKSSSFIGLGIAPSSSYGSVVVANFDPPGNYRGQYSKNVPVPNDNCVQNCKGGSSSFESSPLSDELIDDGCTGAGDWGHWGGDKLNDNDTDGGETKNSNVNDSV